MYLQNKDTRPIHANERVKCECGVEVRRGYLNTHQQTDTHMYLIPN